MKIRDIMRLDLFTAIFSSGVAYYFMPCCVSHDLALAFYNIGVTVLSILFSVFFAALAIILSSSSDDFVKFLERDGSYTAIINLYKYTLAVLFIGLLVSIVASMITSFIMKSGSLNQNKIYSSLFVGLFFYGVFCSYNSAKDAIMYSMYRMKFLKD